MSAAATAQPWFPMLSRKTNRRPPRPSAAGDSVSRLDRRADLVQDAGDLAAQEDEGDDRDNRDEGEDQRVLRETLALLVLRDAGDECIEQLHVGVPPFLESSR